MKGTQYALLRAITFNLILFILVTSEGACTSSNKNAPHLKEPVMKITKDYEIYVSGSDHDVRPQTKSGLILVGGGLDREDALAWFVRQAGFGDIVVLRASGADGYNKPLQSHGANSVTSIVLRSREAAEHKELIDIMRNAEGIFFAGGDQSKYAQYLQDTPLAQEINSSARRGIPIGGSSAGLAILGEFYFPAFKDTITSDETLKDPYHPRLILARGLLQLPHLEKLITDSHFKDRDRMGRLVTFMARILNDQWSKQIRAVGLDENVAVVIDQTGTAQVLADSGHAYLLQANSSIRLSLKAEPLTFKKILVRKLPARTKFNFNDWGKLKEKTYTIDVESGKIIGSLGFIY